MHRSHRLRQVLTLAALTALLPIASGQPLIDMPMSLVPGDELSGGPVYDYRVGRFEVANDQYAVFLNDALVNLDNERGQYMYFDTETGSVYIHSEITGTTGTGPGVTFLFDAETNGAITYNSETSLYEVDADLADHPVTGMSWYGAVKFCNWLTLDQGLDIAQRAYTESTDDDLLGWHPVSISTEDWAVRDLDDDERLDLVDNYAGFRLPMDHGESGASAYSEWFKSAAWLPNADPPDDADYGFGRNILTGADANYLGSGDPFDDGTTPVGYFDGTDHDGAFATTDTENGYGLYDISGNVWEWQTDQGGDDALTHSLRGGSWTSSDVALLNTISSLAGADAVQTTWGFRVVQSIKDVVQVTPDVTVGIEGPYGGEYDIPEQIYTITNLTPDTILVSVIPDVGWLTVDDLQEVIDLELLGKASIDIVVAVAAICEPDDVEDELVVGLNVGTLTFSNDSGGDDILRVIDLTLTEPISVEPDDTTTFDVEGFFDGPFEDTQIYTLTSESASDVLWTAESDQTDPAWLLIDGADTSGGTLIPPDDVTA
ncbi:MAG: SUMF1/EgtB/PvdO family nonheme iron enzyme, partial [Planctomycetes bacterium]|nr:SUMF1/EgtB/PvdO family nonheme iron enzyme [Planctomycetota bacterium]